MGKMAAFPDGGGLLKKGGGFLRTLCAGVEVLKEFDPLPLTLSVSP